MDQELSELRRLAKLYPYDTVIAERLERWLLRSGHVNPIVTLEEQLRNKVATVVGKPKGIISDSSFKQLISELHGLAKATLTSYPDPLVHYESHYLDRDDRPTLRPIPTGLTYFRFTPVNSGAYSIYQLNDADSLFTVNNYMSLNITKPSGKSVITGYCLHGCITNNVITIGITKEEINIPKYTHMVEQLLPWQNTVKDWEAKATNCIQTRKETIIELSDKLLQGKTVNKPIPVFKRYSRWSRSDKPIMPARIKKGK